MEQGLLDFFTSQSDKTAKQREMMQRQMEAEQLMQQRMAISRCLLMSMLKPNRCLILLDLLAVEELEQECN
jgi:hypothetical protein